MRWWGIYHIQRLWVHGWRDSYHTTQSDVRYCLMHYGLFIYIILLMSLLHRTIFFRLITVKKFCSNHIMTDYVVYLILSIDPWCITTSIFHGYFEVTNKKVNDICWVLQGTIFVNPHTFAWMLSIYKYVSINKMIRTGYCLDTVGNTNSIILFSQTTVIMEVNTQMKFTL